MSAKALELTGRVFGRLTVTGISHRAPNRAIMWFADCQCGKVNHVVRGDALTAGKAVSCGCYKSDVQATHGHSRNRSSSAEYNIWHCMIQRCTNPNNDRYEDYGGRGITVCERWSKFENFYADMGPRPLALSLDRRDNNGHYEPGNCRWATALQQAANKRKEKTQ